MTILTTFHAGDASSPVRRERATSEAGEIARELGRVGVDFERWRATSELPPGAGQEDVLGAYRADVERLSVKGGYHSADVVRMHPDHPEREAIRKKFLAEHTHADDEVRFFVEGAGAFYIRDQDGRRVLKIVAERGDLLRLPAGTRHWFDMGPDPYFAAIRLFVTAEGWGARFTGDASAERVPGYLP
jgi:1,2-dihydroxy-3-keto-5-methylthiopentene dioxygenase